jgi:hypothetical protein
LKDLASSIIFRVEKNNDWGRIKAAGSFMTSVAAARVELATSQYNGNQLRD